MSLDELASAERANAIVSWVTLGVVALGAAGSLLSDALLWGSLSLLFVGVASVPALVTRDPTAIVPWPLLAIAGVAVVAGTIDVYPEIAGYLAVATFALLVVVEIDVFTRVELGRRFAVGFSVLATMAVEALWIVAQFYSDRWLGTEFVSTQTELQEDIVIVTAVGCALGGLFYWYLARFEPAGTADRPSSRSGTR